MKTVPKSQTKDLSSLEGLNQTEHTVLNHVESRLSPRFLVESPGPEIAAGKTCHIAGSPLSPPKMGFLPWWHHSPVITIFVGGINLPFPVMADLWLIYGIVSAT